jgi:beta-phosphoglucomutase
MRPQALIVDIDGVVIDTPHERAWREALAARVPGAVLSPAEYRDLVAGRPRLDGARAALARHGVVDEAGVLAYAAAKQARFLALVSAGDFTVFADAVRFLKSARANGLKLAAASSSKNASALLARAGLAALFHADLCGRDVAHGKPAPDLFLLAAAELGVAPAACVVLEDAPSGVVAAKAGGMAAIGIARHGEAAALRAAGADDVVESLADALAWARIGMARDRRDE